MNFLDSFFEAIDYFEGVEAEPKDKGKKPLKKESALDNLGAGFLDFFSIVDDLDEID